MKIAILEDSTSLSIFLTDLLTEAGNTVTVFSDGLELVEALKTEEFEFFILDWYLPTISGFEVLQHIRQELQLKEPVIFLTANQDETQVVKALHDGADDYCIKPLRPQELLARIEALARRFYPSPVQNFATKIKGYHFDELSRTVMFDNHSVVLSEKEFDLAYFLFCNFDIALSRKQLMLKVWGKEETEISRSLDVYVSIVRRKLKIGVGADKVRLLSIHGYGYRLMAR